MAESKQTLRLKLAQGHQALHPAYTRIAALEAEWAAVYPSVQVIAGGATSLVTESLVTSLPAGDRPRPEPETTTQPVETLSNRYARWLEFLHSIDRGLLEAVSIPAMIEGVLKHIRQLIPWQQAAVILFN